MRNWAFRKRRDLIGTRSKRYLLQAFHHYSGLLLLLKRPSLRNKVGLLKGAEAYETAVSRFYPDLPKAHLPLSLPLFNYTGTYQHPAYHNITLFEKDGNLHADRPDATWKLFVDLVHVTGDYFIAYGDSSTSPGLVFKTAGAAEFKIGHDGIPQSLGISLEPEMGISGRIWFDRI